MSILYLAKYSSKQSSSLPLKGFCLPFCHSNFWVYVILTLQTTDSGLKARVVAMEILVPQVQVELKVIAGTLQSLMDRLGKMEQSLLSGSRGSSVLLPEPV